MNTPQPVKRRPIANFFVKPRLQIKLTALFITASVVASFGSLGIFFLALKIDVDGLEGFRTAWYYLKATYPGFGIAIIISITVGLIVGAWASRKVALPVYIVEQWSQKIRKGDLRGKVGLRRTDHWGDMAESCNMFTQELRDNLNHLSKLAASDSTALPGETIKVLSKYKF